MPVYLAKFPDGTVQIASAKNRHDLMHLLDQVGSPTAAQIKSLKGLEWIVEAQPQSVEERGEGDWRYQDIAFSFRIAACDAGEQLEIALSEAYPLISRVGMRGLSLERAFKSDKSADLKDKGWKLGTVPEYNWSDEDAPEINLP